MSPLEEAIWKLDPMQSEDSDALREARMAASLTEEARALAERIRAAHEIDCEFPWDKENDFLPPEHDESVGVKDGPMVFYLPAGEGARCGKCNRMAKRAVAAEKLIMELRAQVMAADTILRGMGRAAQEPIKVSKELKDSIDGFLEIVMHTQNSIVNERDRAWKYVTRLEAAVKQARMVAEEKRDGEWEFMKMASTDDAPLEKEVLPWEGVGTAGISYGCFAQKGKPKPRKKKS